MYLVGPFVKARGVYSGMVWSHTPGTLTPRQIKLIKFGL